MISLAPSSAALPQVAEHSAAASRHPLWRERDGQRHHEKRRRSFPKKISSPTKKVDDPRLRALEYQI